MVYENTNSFFNNTETALFAKAIGLAGNKAERHTNEVFNQALTREEAAMAHEFNPAAQEAPRFGG